MNFRDLLQNKRYLFWALQFLGWSGWALTFYLGILVWGKAPDNYTFYLPLVAVIGMLFTLLLRGLYRYMWDMGIVKRFIGIVAASYFAGMGWMACRSAIFYRLFPEEHKPDDKENMELVSLFDGTISATWVMLVWSALYFGIKYYMLLQEEKQRNLKVMSMAHAAQLKMLRYQLNPHFLFNTLNAISTLVLERETEAANRMVTRLSSFLRYSLDNDPMQKITLEQELAALKLYLDIEKVRFEERLTLELDIDEDAAGALIPSLLLQPLVENAIKYGIARAEEGGHLRIAAKVFAGDLLMVLSDDGPGVALVDGQIPDANGVGLRNTQERLFELYGNQHSFRLSETDPHGLTINIRIPYEPS